MLVYAFTCSNIIAQSYTFNPSTIYITTVDTSENNFGGIEVLNTGTQNLDLTWRLTLKDTLIDSHFEICNSGICSLNLPYSGIMPTIAPGEIGWIKFHMFTGVTTGTNTIKYVLKNGTIQADTLTFIIIVDNTTKLEELENITEATLFPNPTIENQTTLRLNLKDPSEVAISIIDVSGQLISEQRILQLQAGQQCIPITTSHFAQGIYTINILTKNGVTNRKLIINK